MFKHKTISSGLFDPDASIPKYAQLRNRLMLEIQSGKYAVGDKLCTEKELKSKYKISVATITRSLAELERAGLIWRKQGGGTYVKSTTVQQPDNKESAISKMALIISGFNPQSVLDRQNLNWFISYEIYQGIINNFSGGPIKITKNDMLKNVVQSLVPGKCGVIIGNPSSIDIRFLQSSRIPYIIIRQAGFARPQVNTVSSDRFSGVYEGMAYLIEDLGHQKIAFITFRQDDKKNLEHLERTMGYRAALQQFQIPYLDELVVAADTGTVEGGYAAARQLLERKAKFTAVFVDTDQKAVGVIKVLREAGFSVPDDISVLGFDDVPGMENNDPPLTTIRVPHYETGMEAIRLLQKRVAAGNDDMPGVVLKSHLVIRQTCAKSKKFSLN